MAGVPILMYHNVDRPSHGGRLARLYVRPEQFARQLWWLRRLGLRGVSMSEGLRRLQFGDAARCVVLTFDDGYADNLLHAAPLLKSYGFGATCYVVSDAIGTWNSWDADVVGVRKPLMDEAQLQGWLEHGLELGSHTCSHPRLDQLTDDEQLYELVASRERLKTLAGTPIEHFCYPYGYYAAATPALVARAGYLSAVTAQRGRATSRHDRFRLPRLSIGGDKGLLRFLLKAATSYGDHGGRRMVPA